MTGGESSTEMLMQTFGGPSFLWKFHSLPELGSANTELANSEFAPKGKTGLGSCEPPIPTFPAVGQYRALSCVCLWFKDAFCSVYC